MATDLEFRLPTININSSRITNCEITDDNESCCISEKDQCRTPKSPPHVIPAALSCPPAPRKKRRAASRKRKLCELQFFEMVAGDEVQSFFTRIELNYKGTTTKRKCVM
ncbi:hypothetical protein BUALT_Bualt06G0030500 [Buddleja alternifolia]|uniref:Cyclin-dependent protein kinase inhibitor SMR1 n=1 Tax=Buddleja alternifolia TaxID=168488 RepID=A0AAV6XKP4_9LAMI|nr:hypothetical protein BUALT_Bualt06G0030500 [Buddleja alternifolia]